MEKNEVNLYPGLNDSVSGDLLAGLTALRRHYNHNYSLLQKKDIKYNQQKEKADGANSR
jgi:hypothetical protein